MLPIRSFRFPLLPLTIPRCLFAARPITPVCSTAPACTLQASPQEAEEAIRFALAEGYRHIDTARLYKNEAAVGEIPVAPGTLLGLSQPRARLDLTGQRQSGCNCQSKLQGRLLNQATFTVEA